MSKVSLQRIKRILAVTMLIAIQPDTSLKLIFWLESASRLIVAP